MTACTATAHSNIALAKYWGKADRARNLPAVPSLSLTLGALRTRTTVQFDDALAADELSLDGRAGREKELARVVKLLDRVRGLARLGARARVTTANDFPTAAGLASSASGFAALALAATRAAGLTLDAGAVSALAREASVSAARSLHGGWVVLGAGAETAEALAPESHLDVAMLVVLTRTGEKAVGSTEGMNRTSETSPYYPAWVSHAPGLFERIRAGVLAGDLEAIGPAMEASALAMHASMFAASPPIVYFSPATLGAMERVRELRASGVPAYFTMDAGPHVKVLVPRDAAAKAAAALSEVPGVERVVTSLPGPAASVVVEGPGG
ncbi:MAG: diphosphomevalonate decarboxylase [Deltaproteobacteria bacterium]|nr:diphosphomevalonate decarboxylase [Deltaproteobacteria bacterium]